MATLLEYVGNVHIFLGPYRGNPIALYLRRNGGRCVISPKVYPWNDVVGVGETPNKAAADFEEKWKTKGLAQEMYSGPSWEGGIKPERPAPPKPMAAGASAAAKPTAAATAATAARPADAEAPATKPDAKVTGAEAATAESPEKTEQPATTPTPSDSTARPEPSDN